LKDFRISVGQTSLSRYHVIVDSGYARNVDRQRIEERLAAHHRGLESCAGSFCHASKAIEDCRRELADVRPIRVGWKRIMPLK
jgi:hypothetical protein